MNKCLDLSDVSSGTPPHKCGGLMTRIKNCPLCGKDVQKVGYPEDDVLQNYRCSSSEYNFGKDEKLKQVSNGG
jgi:hypothetical protein